MGGVQGVMKLGPPPVPKPPKPRVRKPRGTGAPRKGKAPRAAVEVEPNGPDAWAHGGVTVLDGVYGQASSSSSSAVLLRPLPLPSIETKPAFVRAGRTPPARGVPRRGARGGEDAPLELSSDEEPRVKLEEDVEMNGLLDGPEESDVESEDEEEYAHAGRNVRKETHAQAGGVLVAVKTEDDDEDEDDELEYDELEDDGDDFHGRRDDTDETTAERVAQFNGGGGSTNDGPPDSPSSAPSYESADEADGAGRSGQLDSAYGRSGVDAQEAPPTPVISRPSSRASSMSGVPRIHRRPRPCIHHFLRHPSQGASQLPWRIPTHTPGPSKRSAPLPRVQSGTRATFAGRSLRAMVMCGGIRPVGTQLGRSMRLLRACYYKVSIIFFSMILLLSWVGGVCVIVHAHGVFSSFCFRLIA